MIVRSLCIFSLIFAGLLVFHNMFQLKQHEKGRASNYYTGTSEVLRDEATKMANRYRGTTSYVCLYYKGGHSECAQEVAP